jgi:sodium/potassium/calcium exchanger 6
MISDDDGSLFFIIGFLVAGLAWALIMIPLKGRRLSRSFGAGLVLLYCGFLATGMCYAMGWILR